MVIPRALYVITHPYITSYLAIATYLLITLIIYIKSQHSEDEKVCRKTFKLAMLDPSILSGICNLTQAPPILK